MKITDLDEGFYGRRRPDAYQRDYLSSISGMSGRRREVDDEANLMYRYNTETGKLNQKMVDVRDEREAKAMGWRYEWKDALRVANIIQSKFDPNKFVQKVGTKWVPVNPFKEKKEEPKGDNPVNETATPGATSAANIGTVDAPHISPGKARGKKSYTGSPSTGSGTKAPPQPKVKQPKTKAGTAVNALDMKGTSLFGGPANESSVIKRR